MTKWTFDSLKKHLAERGYKLQRYPLLGCKYRAFRKDSMWSVVHGATLQGLLDHLRESHNPLLKSMGWKEL